LIGLGPLQLIIQSNGTIDFSQDAWLKLASGSSVTIILTGTPGKLSASPCNSKQEFFIGTERYGCNPGHQDITFPDVVTNGGTGVVSSNSPVCVGSQIALFVSPPPTFKSPFSYSWSKLGATFIPSSSVENPTIENATTSNSGIYTVDISGFDGVGNPVTVTRELDVTVSPAPTTANAGLDQTGAATCGFTTVTLAANAPTVGTGAWTILTGTGGTVNNLTSPTSTFTGTAGTAYTLRWTISADCAVSTNDVNITFNANTINLNSALGTDAQSICINTPITDITYAVGGSATGATVSVLPAGLTGVYNSGVFTISGTPTVSGTFNYTVTLTGGCGSGTAAGTITVTPAVEKPVFTSVGATSSRIQGVASGTYTATEINNLPIAYSLSPSTAGTIDANGKVIYNALWSGACTITATATGCNGLKTADHTVYTTWCFALFTGNGALSCAGASFIRGDVGTHVGAVTGFDTPGTLDGQVHKGVDPIAVQAAVDVTNAYNALTATSCGQTIIGTTLGAVGGQVLTPKVYCLGGALNITDDLILDGQNDPNALFIFKVGGALTTLTTSRIILINGASPFNVYWQVFGAVVLGTNSDFSGTIIATDAISLNAGASLTGRALSVNGAIAITINVVTSNCSPFICETDNIAPTFLADPPSIPFCVENIKQATYDPTDINIIPADRPDYYTLKAHDTDLDLNPLIYFDDNCTPKNNLFLHWSITNSLNQPIKDINGLSLDDMVGQVSTYTNAADIIFPGAANADVTYTITYWLKDLNGNTSTTKTASITIKPRPEFL